MDRYIVCNYAGYDDDQQVYIIQAERPNDALQGFILYAMAHNIDVWHPTVHLMDMNADVIDTTILE